MHLTSRYRPLVGVLAAMLAVSASSVALAGDTIDNQNEGGGFVAAGSVTQIRIAGRGGMPGNARAASINITATQPDGPGYVTVYPCGTPPPNASNLNFTAAGTTIANSVLTRLDANGDVCIYSSTRTHLIADVTGAFTTDAFSALTPARLMDTRPGYPTSDSQNAGGGHVGAGSVTQIRIAGRGGIAGDARAASINITATQPDGPGYVTVYPCGTPPPNASNLNFTAAGTTIANSVLTRLDANGDVCIYSSTRTHLIADVTGALSTDVFSAVTPARLMDTRPGFPTSDSQNAGGGHVGAGSVTQIRIAGRGGIAGDARVASINIAATQPDGPGYVTVYPCGTPPPNASNLNFTAAGTTIANSVLTRLDGNGDVCIFSSTRTHLVADVTGALSTDVFSAVTPARLMDTRPAPAPGVAVDEGGIPAPAAGVGSFNIGPAGYSKDAATDAIGAFRINCSLSHMNFDDPIVFPGQSRATHLHAYFGNTAVNANSNSASIASSGNSTCTGGTANRSAYWAPAMIDTATGRPVTSALFPEHLLQVYYKTGYQGVPAGTVQNFPPGLRMVAGTAQRNSAGNNNGVVLYHCLANGATSESFPTCAPGDSLVMAVRFPQCWDGINLDAPDHKSHMAYAVGWGQGANGGGCPTSHTTPLAEITQNYRYQVPASGMSTWRLSSDTYSGPPGYSGHADWWNGWDFNTFQRVVDNCYRVAHDCHMNLLGDGQELR